MSDILSNFFSHLKNNQNNHNLIIIYPQTKIIISLLNILQESGYIRGYRLIINKSKNINLILTKSLFQIEILLKYKNQIPAIKNIIKISKPSKRIYISVNDFISNKFKKKIFNQIQVFSNEKLSLLLFMQGIFIISTSKGIMTHLTAYKLNLGGEILCYIY